MVKYIRGRVHACPALFSGNSGSGFMTQAVYREQLKVSTVSKPSSRPIRWWSCSPDSFENPVNQDLAKEKSTKCFLLCFGLNYMTQTTSVNVTFLLFYQVSHWCVGLLHVLVSYLLFCSIFSASVSGWVKSCSNMCWNVNLRRTTGLCSGSLMYQHHSKDGK